jgi:hypothetical protein
MIQILAQLDRASPLLRRYRNCDTSPIHPTVRKDYEAQPRPLWLNDILTPVKCHL